LAFRFEIDRGVPVGRFHACVPEPVADGHEINPRTEEMNRGGVAIGVWMNTLGGKGGGCFPCSFGVTPQQVSDTEAGHRFAAMVAKDRDGIHRRRGCDAQ